MRLVSLLIIKLPLNTASNSSASPLAYKFFFSHNMLYIKDKMQWKVMRIDAVFLMANLLKFLGLRRTSETHKSDLISFASWAVFSCPFPACCLQTVWHNRRSQTKPISFRFLWAFWLQKNLTYTLFSNRSPWLASILWNQVGYLAPRSICRKVANNASSATDFTFFIVKIYGATHTDAKRSPIL